MWVTIKESESDYSFVVRKKRKITLCREKKKKKVPLMARRLSGVKELIWNSCLIILPSHRSDSCKVYNGRGRIDILMLSLFWSYIFSYILPRSVSIFARFNSVGHSRQSSNGVIDEADDQCVSQIHNEFSISFVRSKVWTFIYSKPIKFFSGTVY